MILDNSGKCADSFASYWLRIYYFYAIHYPFFQMDIHTHDTWEIMYVVHGKCKVLCVEDCQEKEYELRDGEYILLSNQIPHKLTVEKESPCRILNLEGKLEPSHSLFHLEQLFSEKLFRKFMDSSEHIILGNDDGSLYATLQTLISELKKQTVSPGVVSSNLLIDFLLGQFLLLLARQSIAPDTKTKEGNLYVRKTLKYLEKNFDRDIHISDIANEAGISQGYLQRLFKKETGISLIEKISELRVEKAKLLLETSSLPIVDIAINVGFNSRQHFAVVFTSLTGFSPKEWRNNTHKYPQT